MAHASAASHVPRYALNLGARGRVVLPAPVRAQLALKEGDTLVLVVEADGTLRLSPLARQAQRLEGAFRHLRGADGGSSLVDELIAERRAEAARDEL